MTLSVQFFTHMATYIYETIPDDPKKKSIRFEVQQSMNDKPLEKHPETGEKVRRVIVGGLGFISSGKEHTSSGHHDHGCGCGGSCSCGH